MKKFGALSCLFSLLLLSNCATIMEPSKQTIAINSDPAGATCDVTRAGKSVANLITPGIFTVSKSHNNLIIRCQKPGYRPITGVDVSHNRGWIIFDLATMALISTIVDVSTSADDAYGESIKLKFEKLSPDDQ